MPSLNPQSRFLVYRAYKFFKRLQKGEIRIDGCKEVDVQDHVAWMAGISRSTVKRIVREANEKDLSDPFDVAANLELPSTSDEEDSEDDEDINSAGPKRKKTKMGSEILPETSSTSDPQNHNKEEITDFKDALKRVLEISDFVLLKKNLRAVGILNQVENLLKAEINKVEQGGSAKKYA